MTQSQRICLALGSGGARGYAHIGVLQELTERGHEVVAVAGTSMGAVVGGMAATGNLTAFTDWVSSLTQRSVWMLMDPSFGAPGVIRGERLFKAMNELLEGHRIEELPIPFTAVATDLDSRQEVWFQSGPLDAAIRASIAIPSLFTPVTINGRLLVDGGMTNPVPIEPTIPVPADLTIAVSLTGGPSGRRTPEPRNATETPEEKGRRRRADDHASWHALPRDLSYRDVVARALDVSTELMRRYRMAGYPPDVLVSIPADSCKVMDFHRAKEMIELGRGLARRTFDDAGL